MDIFDLYTFIMYICWYINCLLYVHSFSLISNMSIILLKENQRVYEDRCMHTIMYVNDYYLLICKLKYRFIISVYRYASYIFKSRILWLLYYVVCFFITTTIPNMPDITCFCCKKIYGSFIYNLTPLISIRTLFCCLNHFSEIIMSKII